MVDIQIEIPEHFLDEEVRCGYTVSSEMKKVWAVELDLCAKLFEVCKKHNITCFAASGTMLGAVRHKGFIPWDDDIDIMMTRDQYDKLCAVADQEFNEPYFFQTEYTDPGTLRGHAQLRNSDTTGILYCELDPARSFNQGIFIDIFPYDNIPEGEQHFQKLKKHAAFYRKLVIRINRIIMMYDPNKKGMKGCVYKLLHLLLKAMSKSNKPEKYIYRKFENACQKANTHDTEYMAPLSFSYSERFFKLREDYRDVIYMPFEFMEMPVCNGYDRSLKMEYGDYMKFVRGSSYHGGVLFDTDKGYKTYFAQSK